MEDATEQETPQQRPDTPLTSAPLTSTTWREFFSAISPTKLCLILGVYTALRLALLPGAYVGICSWLALAVGLLSDVGLSLVLSFAQTALERRHPKIFQPLWALTFALIAFEALTEFFYFDEFGTRFDQVVLDYIFYTGEVTGNVFESYPVIPLALGCVIFGLSSAWLIRKESHDERSLIRWQWRLTWFALGLVLFVASMCLKAPFTDRTTRELSRNGLASLAEAAFTGELDYASHYSTMDTPTAHLRQILSREAGFSGFVSDEGIRRKIDTSRPLKTPDVVLILAESFGRELTERGMGPNEKSLTPQMDRIFLEGTLFDRFYATGTRTARVLEGAITSFPPLPGNAIVRLRSQRTLDAMPAILKSRGYTTTFAYGGDLSFDNMDNFLKATGFDRALENLGAKRPDAFKISWGVADEFLLDEVVTLLQEAKQSNQPAFITALTVSNHRPFLFPKGRIDDSLQKKRAGAALYGDFALGRFFDALKANGLKEGTIVAIVGDHGPRSYTRQRMPADAHRVPFFLWGDDAFITPGQVHDVIGSTIDVAPTILGILGGSYEAAFFGRDLNRLGIDEGMAPMQDKQDVGVRDEAGITILGFNGHDRFQPLTPQDAPSQPPQSLFKDIPQKTETTESTHPIHQEQKSDPRSVDNKRLDAISLFQSAYELYVNAP